MKTPELTSVSFQDVHFLHSEIFNVVDCFYKKVATDDLLAKPFASVMDWPEHIERMTNFWWIKFGGKPYMFAQYSPIPKHYFSGFNETLLERWLLLFKETLQEVELSAPQIETWKAMSQRMGKHLLSRNEMFADFQAKKVKK